MRWLSLILYLALCALLGRVLVPGQQPVHPDPEQQLEARCQALLEEVVGPDNVRVSVCWRSNDVVSASVLLKNQPESTVAAVERLARGCLGIAGYFGGSLEVVNWLPDKQAATPPHHSSLVMEMFDCRPPTDPLKPLRKSNAVSGGQAAVAMCVNSLTGQAVTDLDINSLFGFELLNALNAMCPEYRWKDEGEVGPLKWPLIESRLQRGVPVIVAVNGPEFDPTGRGEVLVLVAVAGDVVVYADPGTGTLRTTTKASLNSAPEHPDGNFIFCVEGDKL